MSAVPLTILVVANETVGGRALIDAVRHHAEQAHEQNRPFHVTVICPQNQPRHGYVVYDESVRSAAENRLATTLAQLREVGIEASGDIMDPDPYNATMDAFREFGADEIIVSTHPATRSGWLRRDLIDRVRDATGVPVEIALAVEMQQRILHQGRDARVPKPAGAMAGILIAGDELAQLDLPGIRGREILDPD